MIRDRDNKWNERFLELSDLVASWSKDTSRGVGAVIVNKERRVVSMGYNGFPMGVDDSITYRYERPHKYSYTEHAERNAIYSAASHGVKTSGCTMYLRWHPCDDCARAIIQSGISKLVCSPPSYESEVWGPKFMIANEMLMESAVEVEYVEGPSELPHTRYRIGDLVSHRCDKAPFKVTGITINEIELEGDWSGGMAGPHYNEKCWVNYEEVKPYIKQ
jgi:dCMP deaminase